MQRPFLYVLSAALLGAFLVGIFSHGSLFQSTWLTKHDHEWQYKRDSRNYGLDEKQCEAAFPKYGLEVDRSIAFRRYDHIREEEVETGWRGDGIVRAMIYDNQRTEESLIGTTASSPLPCMPVPPLNYLGPRALATLHSIHRAIIAFSGPLPNIEFTITMHDRAEFWGLSNASHTTWAFAKKPKQKNLWLMPDFGLWSWPVVGIGSYAQLQSEIIQQEVKFKDKIPSLVWRGQMEVGVAGQNVRSHLIEAAKGQPWGDVQSIDWQNKTDVEEKRISMEDHCRYMFVAQTEGNTYSGRMKLLHNCRSVVISHKLNWTEPWHHLLEATGPTQNYILVNRNFTDLEKNMIYYTEHLDEAQRIADNSVAKFRERYLTPAAQACYWRKLFRGYAKVSFKPEFYHTVEEKDNVTGETRKVRRPRGVPFESFVIMEAVEWDIPPKPRKIVEYD